MALLGDFIGGALGMQSAEDYVGSVGAASRLRELQRKNQFTDDMMKYGQPDKPAGVQAVEPFNPADSTIQFDNLQQPGLRNIPPPPKVETPATSDDGFQDTPSGQDGTTTAPKTNPDGSIVIEPSADGTLKDGPTTDTPDPFQDPANETSLLPDLGPELPDLSTYNRAARAGETAKRKNLQTSLTDIMKSAGIRRKAGIAGRNVTKEQGNAYKWWSSDDAFRLFYNNPRLLDEARRDPIGFAKRYSSQQPQRTQSDIAANSGTRTKKLIDGRIEGLKTQIDGDKVQEVYKAANEIGIDPFAAIAIFGIESDFGQAKGVSAKGAVGGMQVMPEQFNRLKKWFADPANLDQIKNAFRMPNGEVNMARVEYAIQTFSNMQQLGSRGRGTPNANIYAGLAQLVYNKAIGLPKNLWGAGYQGNANKVLEAGRPLMVDDGNISNSDYNRAYVTLYNHVQQTYGLKLSEVETPYGIDLNTIAGSGVGQPVMQQVQAPPQNNQTANAQDNQPQAGVSTGQQQAQTQTSTDGYEIRQEDGPVVYKDGKPVFRFAGPDGQQKAEDYIAGETGTGSISNPSVQPDENTITRFLENPPNIGIEMNNLLKQRELTLNGINRQLQLNNEAINAANAKAAEYDRYAEIALANGQIATFERYQGLAQTEADNARSLRDSAIIARDGKQLEILQYDNKMLLAQGAQALRDLSFGSTARAGAVMSAFTGLDIQVQPRSDGKFDIVVEGNVQQTLSMTDLSDRLQRTYSQAYRDNQTKILSERQTYLFEKSVDLEFELSKERNRITGEIKKQALKGQIDAYLKKLEQMGGEFKALGNGMALIQQNGQFFLMNPAKVFQTADGKAEERMDVQQIPLAQAMAMLSGVSEGADYIAATE